MIRRQVLQQEIAEVGRADAHDIVRCKKIDDLVAITGRELVIYAVDFLGLNPFRTQITGGLVSIQLQDKDVFDEITRNLTGAALDVLIYSGGGSAEATESIVEILRSRFDDVRFIVPDAAKSAATMMAMSGNQILMDERSELGPTDPQMLLIRDNQQIVAPAQAIIDQFKSAQEEINGDPTKLPSWVPILREYGPSLLAQCQNHLDLATKLVSKWLEAYMFEGDSDAKTKADTIAKHLADHNMFKSHARRIGIGELTTLGVNVLDMRTEPDLQAAVRDLSAMILLTLEHTNAFKVVENNLHEGLMGTISIEVTNVTPPELQPMQQRKAKGPDRKQPKQPRGRK
jgi:hypothetical protein